jgi:hypothetical protein
MTLEVLPQDLKIGDTILVGIKGILVRKLGVCQSTKHGVPKIHVNESACYTNLLPLKISRPNPK